MTIGTATPLMEDNVESSQAQPAGDARAARSLVGAMPWRAEWMAASALLIMGFVLRILYILRYRMDSDEPQHLHVAWGWVNGFLQYRDQFDNHMPLFHMLSAPLVAVFGERAELLILMRLAMLPLYVAAIVCVYWIGRTLWGARVGLWAAVWVALLRPLFITSVEYRADDLWMVFWLWGIALLVGSGLRPWRSLLAGLAFGAAIGVSMKTGPLIVAALAAGSATMLVTCWQYPWRQRAGQVLLAGLAGLAGLLVIPVTIVLYFAFRGAWNAFVYANFKHNLVSGGGHPLDHWVLVVLPVTLGSPIVWTLLHAKPVGELAVRRVLFVLLTMIALVLLAFWPVVTSQDYLVVYPLVGLLAAAVVEYLLNRPYDRRIARWVKTSAAGFAVVGGLFGLVEMGILIANVPARNAMAEPVRMWRDVLRLTDPGQQVIDRKGELIFRPRSYYYILETMTGRRAEMGLLPDDVPERMVETKTCVAGMTEARLPRRIAAFFRDNYVSVGRLLVAGKRLDNSRSASGAIAFDVHIAVRYGILSATGMAKGLLDGLPYDGPRDLTEGRHTYEPAPGERDLVLVWAQALERGFRPVPAWRREELTQ